MYNHPNPTLFSLFIRRNVLGGPGEGIRIGSLIRLLSCNRLAILLLPSEFARRIASESRI